MRHPRVDELLHDPPLDEFDAARRERVQDALGPLDDPAAVLALWDGWVSALVDVIRHRGDYRGYRGSGRPRVALGGSADVRCRGMRPNPSSGTMRT